MPQRRQYFESAACWRDGRACTGSSKPNVTLPGRPEARSPTCGSSAFTTSVDSAGSSPTATRQRSAIRSSSPGADSPSDVREGCLVDLEQSELSVSGSQQRRGHTRDEVRPCSVVGEPYTRREDRGLKRGGGRLPVGRRHDRGAELQAPGKGRDCTGVDAREKLPGQRRSAASTGESRQTAGRARGGNLEGETHLPASLVRRRGSPGRGE